MQSTHPSHTETHTLFDNDFRTIAHTADNRTEAGIITITLVRPALVHRIIMVSWSAAKYRMNGTTITLENKSGRVSCGAVKLQTGSPNEIVNVDCGSGRFLINKILITKRQGEESLVIAELRICGSKPGML